MHVISKLIKGDSHMSGTIKKLERELEQERNLEDESYQEGSAPPPSRYEVTSFGVDFDIEGLVRQLQREEIYIPAFQRAFVWKMSESSRFIESLLLGLPVPGIFLAQDSDTKKLLVIDGQQRLLSLKFFYEGYFNKKGNSKGKRTFKLLNVQEPYEGKTYESLDHRDQFDLDHCVIHATVVKQDSSDDTSIYPIFERLNSGGMKLTPQEIRTAMYQGKIANLIAELNGHSAWRSIFGPSNDRMRDHELILRFFAMFDAYESYKKPMATFLTTYMSRNRNMDDSKCAKLKRLFEKATDLFFKALSSKAFRPIRALNVALYEASMVGLAFRLDSGVPVTSSDVLGCYQKLTNDDNFTSLISKSTTDTQNVSRRLEISKRIFAGS